MSDEDGPLIEEIVEDVWDCSSCGKQGIRGRELACPGCGNGREQTEAYRDGDGVAVTDQAVLAVATAGANWACAYCGMDNRAADAKCQRCGATPDAPPPQPLAAPVDAGPGVFVRLLQVLGAGVAFLVLAYLGILGWVHRTHHGTVTKLEWRRYVYIEQRVDKIEEAWDQAPPDTRVLESRVIPDGAGYQTVITGYRPDVERWTEKVQDGEEPYTVMEQVADGTETYYDSERVQDGYTTRQRTERVQTGTTKELVRTERLGNGFSKKIYREVPVYGSRTVEDREPAYRTVQVTKTRARYRPVAVVKHRPHYKDVERTKPIQVPITRRDPRPRTKVKFAHTVWESREARTASGEGMDPAWPKVELKGEPEPERETGRAEYYYVTFTESSGSEHSYETRSFEDYRKFALGQKRRYKTPPMELLD